MVLYRFLELHPPKKTVIIIKAKMNITKTKSPSNAAIAVLLAIGTINSAVNGSVR